MTLVLGTTLGPSAVAADIGGGGRGEMYGTRDTKLDRDVVQEGHNMRGKE